MVPPPPDLPSWVFTISHVSACRGRSIHHLLASSLQPLYNRGAQTVGLGIAGARMHRTITSLVVLMAIAAPGLSADRHWQTGTWGEVTTQRKMVDFGPGTSGFGPPRSSPTMQAMADVRRFIIETDEMRLEMEDTVPIGRRSIESIDVTVGGMVMFALEKSAVYVRDP